MHTHLILGGPGAGKTHRLMDILDSELSAGTRPDRIAFVSFTRRAVKEARERVLVRFKLSEHDTPYFRTLHSLAYSLCAFRAEQVLGSNAEHFKELEAYTSTKFSTTIDAGDLSPYSGSIGDRGIFLDNFARVTQTPLVEVARRYGEGIRWNWLQWFSETLKAYKKLHALVDFTDMLESALSCAPIGIDVAIIDEAQDLSRLQWSVARTLFRNAKRVYYAGDDDQAIYKWGGADVEEFLSLDPSTTEVLPKSNRLPDAVYRFSQSIIGRVRKRYRKHFSPSGRAGDVVQHRHYDSIPIHDGGQWLLLARNRIHLRMWEDLARRRGVPYTTRRGGSVNHDDIEAIKIFENLRGGGTASGEQGNTVLKRIGARAKFKKEDVVRFKDIGVADVIWYRVFDGISEKRRAYYLAMLRRGVDISADPRVHIDTIHASKGGEADNVAVITDVTRLTYRHIGDDPDDENRTFYVGVTRAKNTLHILLPQTTRSYKI
ncbi:MAG TPA: ATP-dependent helicase [Smithellaceae bacterium]|jgi:superfamily I DNA/RNA helicase|nr:ATP-dependent helicase [Bacillota bacterium]HQC11118.1 ATP-dependent helicase [Smithellaceae bacterium]